MYKNSREKRPEMRALRSMLLVLLASTGLLATLLFPSPSQALEPTEFAGSTVYLINAGTGRFLDADANGSVGQSVSPKQDDQWHMSSIGGDTYNLVNARFNRYLDADGADRDYDVNLSGNNRDADTQWQFAAQGDGTYVVTSVEYGQALDGDYANKGYAVNLTQNVEDVDARWYVVVANAPVQDLDGTIALLHNAGTGRFLDIDGGSVDQSVVPKADDQWLIADAGNGQYTFRSVQRDRLLDGGTMDVDVRGQGKDDTRWTLTQRHDGSYEIQNVGLGLWLDGDYADKDWNVDLTANIGDRDAHWNILVLDSDVGCVTEALTTIDQALLCVNADDMFVHLQAFQAHADANGGIRQSGTPGYDASANYVAGLLESAGFIVERQVFDFSVYTENSVSLSADGVPIETQTMSFSGSGDVVAGNIVSVDLDLGLGNASTSGCEIEDFAALDMSGPNDIALMQRGACAFSTKVINAQQAGAEAAIVFNQGNTEDRTAIIGATLGAASVGVVTIPALDVAYADGVTLSEAASADLSADTTTVTSTTENVIADLPGVNAGNVVMAGAHLDSVQQGPGVQDNGSGSAALLSIALMLANNETYVPQNSLRFAWWGAEEAGLIGSNEYIFNPEFGITDEEYAALSSYLNFDMISSPNYVFGVYDADQSTFEAPVPIPEGSAAIEDLFEAYYTIKDVPYDDSEFSGRSDYQAFINVGIPAAGLFTGAEVLKTPEQADIWGGIAGEQFDQCYHLACDTIDNVSYEASETNIDAVMYAIFNLAGSTAAINGVAGVPVQGITPDQVVFNGPEGTFAEGGGGLAPDHDHDHDEGATS